MRPDTTAVPASSCNTRPQDAPEPSRLSAADTHDELSNPAAPDVDAMSDARSDLEIGGGAAHKATSHRSPTHLRTRRISDVWISAHWTSRDASAPKHSAKSDRAVKSSSRILSFRERTTNSHLCTNQSVS